MKKHGKYALLIALGAFSLLFFMQAGAQVEDPSTLYQKTTVIDIPEDSYDVDRDGPGMISVDGRREKSLKNLIRFRQDFRNKILSSAKGL